MSSLDPTWHELLHETTHEFLHIDGKIFRTLRLLFFQPGELTAEYLRGRRAPYIGALRLYLTMSLAYFLTASVIPNPDLKFATTPPDATYSEATTNNQTTNAFVSRLASGWRIAQSRSEEFGDTLHHTFPKLMFVLVPFFALLLNLAYRNRGGHYPKYLYLSLHVHAAVFGFLILTLPLQSFASDAWLTAAQIIVLFGSFLYLVSALRRLFGGRLLANCLRAAAVSGTYLAGFAVATGLVIVVLIYRLGGSATAQ